jgi:hypothetical protein
MTTLAIIALCITGAAWVLTAAALVQDLLGRPLARRNVGVGARRRQLMAGLALMTVVVLTEVSALGDWPRPLRGSIGLLDMLVAFVFVVRVLSPVRRGRARRSES